MSRGLEQARAEHNAKQAAAAPAVTVEDAAVRAINAHEWDPEFFKRTAHEMHVFHDSCEVCSGDVRAIVKVLAEQGLLAGSDTAGSTTEWGIKWDNPVPGLKDITGPYTSHDEAAHALTDSVFPGRVVTRTLSPWCDDETVGGRG